MAGCSASVRRRRGRPGEISQDGDTRLRMPVSGQRADPAGPFAELRLRRLAEIAPGALATAPLQRRPAGAGPQCP